MERTHYEEDRIYYINGRKFTFTAVHMEAGMLRGYCQRLRKWAWLDDKFVQIEGSPVTVAELKND